MTKDITEESLEQAVKLIRRSKKPFVFVGGGAVISGANEELKKFVERVDAPVCDSLMGKGAYPGTDDRYTGMLGMHGTKVSNLGVSGCDLILKNLDMNLEKEHIKVVGEDVIGKTFNTDYMEAVSSIQTDDENKRGKVVDVLECGFIDEHNDKTCVYSKVIVFN